MWDGGVVDSVLKNEEFLRAIILIFELFEISRLSSVDIFPSHFCLFFFIAKPQNTLVFLFYVWYLKLFIYQIFLDRIH